MILKDLLNRTDMIFHKYDGVITDHGDYISIETPSNPGYFWGNYLIFDRPPVKDDDISWRKTFKDRFGRNPLIRHEVYAWENQSSANPILDPFLNDGFRLEQHAVMSATKLKEPKKWTSPLVMRPLENQDDWNQALENQVLIHRQEFGEKEYREYRKKKNSRYQKMISEGLGQWFGAFVGEKLVGDLGIFQEAELGRYQMVSTHPDYRRQGVCSRLLHFSGEYALQKMGLETLVIAADDTYFAKDIYESVGFEICERIVGIEKRPT